MVGLANMSGLGAWDLGPHVNWPYKAFVTFELRV